MEVGGGGGGSGGGASSPPSPSGTPLSPLAALSAATAAASAAAAESQRTGSQVVVFGSAEYGQLGVRGDEAGVLVPTVLPASLDDRVVAASAGERHSAVVTSGGVLYTWGDNTFGQLGRSGRTRFPAPVSALEVYSVVDVACGEQHTLALVDNGDVFAMGAGEQGQLGLGSRESQNAPRKIRMPHPVRLIACGSAHSAAVTVLGTLFTWGQGGLLGTGDVASATSPQVVKRLLGKPVIDVSCGKAHTACVTAAGFLYTFGRGSEGQLGHGTATDEAYPRTVQSLVAHRIVRCACGGLSSSAVDEMGALYTFGAGGTGMLGHGDSQGCLVPRAVTELMGTRVASCAMGGRHTLAAEQPHALTGVVRVHAWGAGGSGQTGLGRTEMQLVPRPVDVQRVWRPSGRVLLACGGFHTLLVLNAHSRALPPIVIDVEHVAALCALPTLQPFPGTPATPASASAAASASLSSTAALPLLSSLGTPLPIPPRVQLSTPSSLLALSSSPGALGQLAASFVKSTAPAALLSAQPVVDVRALERLLERSFSHPSNVSGAFVRTVPHIDFLKTMDPAVDATRRLYAMLVASGDTSAMGALSRAARQAATSLSEWLPLASQFDAEAVRCIPLLLQNPVLLKAESMRLSVEQLAQFIMTLSRATQQELVTWYASSSADHLLRTVQVFQNTLSLMLRSSDAPDNAVVYLCSALELLYRANTLGDSIIPYTRFYNDDVSRRTNLQVDFESYIGSGVMFSFCKYPFLYDAVAKSKIMSIDVQLQQAQHMIQSLFHGADVYLTLTVRREHLVKDALTQLRGVPPHLLRRPLRVTLQGEDAADAGGVRKEFFQLLVREIFNPDYGMFEFKREHGVYWFNSSCIESSTEYELIGVLIGVAIFNGVILPLRLPVTVYKKLTGARLTLMDLSEVEPALGTSLQQLLDYDGDDVEEIFGLTFTATTTYFDTTVTHELRPGGADIPVTPANKQQYVDLYVDFMLNKQVEKQFSAFARGMMQVCNTPSLRLFRAEEYDLFVSGDTAFDMRELQAVTRYEPPYSAAHPTVQLFWRVVLTELSADEQRQLLRFATGSDRVPVGGLSQLPFVIQRAGDDARLLPSAHTCFNVLDLPEYRDADTLRVRLRTALQNAVGFGLQ